MINTIALLSSLFFSSEVFAAEKKTAKAIPEIIARCYAVSTNVIYDQKNNEAFEKICKYTYDELTYYVSETCALGECALIKDEKKKIKVPDYKSTIGSPGFKLCEAIGGIPQIYSFKSNELGNEKTDRCFVGAKDFVEIPLLERLYQDLIQL